MYSVWISEKAKKQLKKLPEKPRKLILNKIYSIRQNPFRYLKKLGGSKLWRLRIMDYRAVVNIIISEKKIFVLIVDKRARVY
tara:strand:- start:259 stop:504 length:246 start_codon:yes stop_codon:yes gene_type:complete